MASNKTNVYALASVICVSVSLPVNVEQPSDRLRTIEHRPGVSLKSRLLPDDRVVVVTRTVHGIRSVDESALAQEVMYSVGVSDAVVLADIVETASVLIEDESWIGTPLTFRTVEVVTPIGAKLPKAGTVIWNGGGELVIAGVTVRAGLPWRKAKTSRYLLFLWQSAETGQYYFARTPLAIEDERTIDPWLRDGVVSQNDVLHGQPLKFVINSLRNARTIK